jgi:hypothetical protein
MRSKRLLWFFLMILLGLLAGMLYGWFINPVQHIDDAPNNLRADYKADFILMTAEIYHMDQNLEEAVRRLGMVSRLDPDQAAAEGLATARGLAYSVEDLALMERMYLDLQNRAASSAKEGQP